MESVVMADLALTLCSQQLLFAGQPLLFKTNSPDVARHAGHFLPEHYGRKSNPPARATITIHVRETNEPCERAPWFRARGHFAFARFTTADTFWLNLRTREVYGLCTSQVAEDAWLWRAQILPALLGILSPVLGVAPVHAACLVRDGQGVLLTAPSGTGKSTLTIALAKRRYALLSDEWTYLSPAGFGVEAWGLPVPVKLLPDASRFFPELLQFREAESLNGETAYDVFPDECFGVLRQTSCPVKVIVLLVRSPNLGVTFSRISAADAIAHLTKEIEPLEGPLAQCYEEQLALIRRLADAQCLRLSFNDRPDVVAEALDAALTRMR